MADLKTELELILNDLQMRDASASTVYPTVVDRLALIVEKMNTAVKPYGWQDELLQQIADKVGLPGGADLEGILPLLDEKLKGK